MPVDEEDKDIIDCVQTKDGKFEPEPELKPELKPKAYILHKNTGKKTVIYNRSRYHRSKVDDVADGFDIGISLVKEIEKSLNRLFKL